jgi:hypothetical protein
MGYKAEADELFNSVLKMSHHKIKRGEDLKRIIETAYQFDLKDELEQLAFSGKFSNGLFKIIQAGGGTFEPEYFEKIKVEYTESLQEVKNRIEKILEKSSDFFSGIFREKYFTLSHEALKNLADLCADLNYLKIYINEIKRK